MYCTWTCKNRSGTWGRAIDKATNKHGQPVEPERKQEERDWCLFLVQALPICVTHCVRSNSHLTPTFLMCRFLLFASISFSQIKVKTMLISCGKKTAHWVTRFIKLFFAHHPPTQLLNHTKTYRPAWFLSTVANTFWLICGDEIETCLMLISVLTLGVMTLEREWGVLIVSKSIYELRISNCWS